MSDGDNESARESDYIASSKHTSSEDFVQAIAKLSVAQICESEGFQGFQQSALEVLADVAARYIREVGKIARHSADSAARLDCNVFDVVQGLEDLGYPIGFPGATDVHRCIANSGVIRDISQYVSLTEELPFAYSLPRFPISREYKLPPSFLQCGEDSPLDHIPAWLPVFPDSRSCMNTASCSGRGMDTCNGRVDAERERKEEESLLNMQNQHAASNGFEQVLSIDHGNASKSLRAVESNPFLAPPLQHGEKEVAPVVLPSKLSQEADGANHTSALGPPFGTEKDISCEVETEKKNILLDHRSAVRFKFSHRRKSLPTSTNFIAQKKEDEKLDSCFEIDDEKDEKKRRKEQILRGSMENPQELAQL